MSAHIPYGYRIVDGKAVVDKAQAEQVRRFFEEYISGKSLKAAAKEAGLKLISSSAGCMLRNIRYLGDDYYPTIIEQDLFDKAEAERQFRAGQIGKTREMKVKAILDVAVDFRIGRQTKVCYDPFEQAEYAYSLIESEMGTNGNN